MRLITQTQVTVDGVMQGNGGASDEDRKSGFERGGWAMGAFDDETLAFITRTYQSADAFLFGRQTYDVFAPYWGAMEPGSHPIADALNTTPKYVVSNTLTDGRWADTTVLSGDVAAVRRELRRNCRIGGAAALHQHGNDRESALLSAPWLRRNWQAEGGGVRPGVLRQEPRGFV